MKGRRKFRPLGLATPTPTLDNITRSLSKRFFRTLGGIGQIAVVNPFDACSCVVAPSQWVITGTFLPSFFGEPCSFDSVTVDYVGTTEIYGGVSCLWEKCLYRFTEGDLCCALVSVSAQNVVGGINEGLSVRYTTPYNGDSLAALYNLDVSSLGWDESGDCTGSHTLNLTFEAPIQICCARYPYPSTVDIAPV